MVDWTQVIVALVTTMPVLLLSIANLRRSKITAGVVTETHRIVNSGADQLREAAERVAEAQAHTIAAQAETIAEQHKR